MLAIEIGKIENNFFISLDSLSQYSSTMYCTPLNVCLINDLWFFPSSLSYLISLPPHAVSNSRSSCSTCYFAQSPVSQLHVITVFKPDNNTAYYSFEPSHSRSGLLLLLVATPVSHIRLSYNLVNMNTQGSVHGRSIRL